MIIGGIDPGKTGAFSVLIDGEPAIKFPMPTIKIKAGKSEKTEWNEAGLCALLEEYRPDHVFYEQAHAMPGQGVVSMFSVGAGYMMVRTALAALKIPSTEVPARRWQKAMFYGISGEDTGVIALKVCQRMWPHVDFRATPHPRSKPHEGMVDATLIAEWGRRSLEGGWDAPNTSTTPPKRRKGKRS